jgi:hypothetical protein
MCQYEIQNFWNKKNLEIPKNSNNLKIVLPEDLFNMTNGHDLCRASAHKPNCFPTLSASMFSKQPTVKIVCNKTNGQDLCAASCQYLPTYLPINQFLKFLINFPFSLSNRPMRSLSTNPTVKIYALLLPPTNCPALSLSL